MIVREIEFSERDKFLLLSKQLGSIFVDAHWIDAHPSPIKLFGVFTKKSNDLIGGFCLHKTSKYGIPFLRDVPFSPHVSLFYSNKTTNPANYNSFKKKIYSAISYFLTQKKFHLISISLPPEDTDMLPFIWDGLHVKLRYTYQIDLTADEKSIYSNFSPERRNDIAKAIKDGVTAIEVFDYSELQQLVLKTFEMNRLGNFTDLVQSVFHNFAKPENSAAFVAYHNSKPSACSFVVYNQRQAYYILGGYDKENRHHGAGALCIWEAIKAVRKKNVQVFDFEGSTIPAIESFFRGFGGDLVPFYQIRKYPLIKLGVL